MKKKSPIIGALLVVAPTVVFLFSQLFAGFACEIFIIISTLIKNPEVSGEEAGILAYEALMSQEGIFATMVVSSGMSALVMALWYFLGMKDRDIGIRRLMNPKRLLMCILLGFGIQFAVTIVVNLVLSVLPESASEDYGGLMESLVDVTKPATLLMLIVFAPIGEECSFRGLTLLFGKEHFGATAAVVASSVLFGAIHLSNDGGSAGTVIQMAYALAIGLFFARITLKFKSIWPAVLIHAVIDGSSFPLTLLENSLADNPNGELIMSIVMVAGGIASLCGGVYLYVKTPYETELTKHELFEREKGIND